MKKLFKHYSWSIVASFAMFAATYFTLNHFYPENEPIVHAQTQGAACSVGGSFTTTGNSIVIDNRQLGCYQWRLSYNSTGFSGVSISVQSAPDVSGAPGSWTNFTGATVVTDGTNPSTSTNAGIIGIHSGAAWVRVNL